ncbi:MAG: formate/nitrite transporter family protein [Gammaproteobacteria bacterium]
MPENREHRFCVAPMMAGAYVGLGIILIFSVGALIDPAWQKLVMGASFGVALTLILFAGAELFTGHTMYMTIGCRRGTTRIGELLRVWGTSWLFNLLGSVALALLFITGGGGVLTQEGTALVNKVASYKMNSSGIELLARGLLCNWLVCLALWMAARTQSDTTKAIIIFWCLYAFIASGYEHSVANMTLLSIALLGEPTSSISLAGMAHNLSWVTLGNIFGGAVFMGIAYIQASPKSLDQPKGSTAQSSTSEPETEHSTHSH